MRNTFIIILFLLFISACGFQKTQVPDKKGPYVETESSLFKMAEGLYEQGKFEESIVTYQSYLDRYPKSDMRDAVLLKIGMAHREINKDELAINYFNQLIQTMPESSLVTDARIEILAVYVKQGRFREIEEISSDLLAKPLADNQRLRINSILGDSFVALGKPEESIEYYDQMLLLASDSVRQSVFDRVQSAVDQLNQEQTQRLIEKLPDGGIRGHLLFHAGLLNYDAKDFTATQTAFDELLNKYPKFKVKDRVSSILESIASGETFQPYTFGCLLPLSGPYAAYGQRALRGIEMALIRFAETVPDLMPRLVIKDTKSNPETAINELKVMAEEGVAAVIGPMVTAEQVAMTADALGVPILTLTQKDYITDSGPYVFRNFITPEMQVKALVNYSAETLGAKRYAILYPQENYGITFMDLFWDEIVVHDGMAVGVESYGKEQTDFADAIKKLVGLYYPMSTDERNQALAHASLLRNPEEALQFFQLNEESLPLSEFETEEEELIVDNEKEPDELESVVDFNAVFIPDSPKKVGLIIPQLAYYDINDVYLLGTNIWHSDSLIRMSRKYLKDVVIVDGFFTDSEDPAIQEFVSNYMTNYNENPEIIAATAYDTALIILELLKDQTISLRSQIKEQLLEMPPFQGITGKTTFRPNGDASKDLFILGVQRGKFVELGRLNPYPNNLEINSEKQRVVEEKKISGNLGQ